MALSTVQDYQTAVNQIFWAWFKNHGYRFPYNELVRDGGMTDADARTLRAAYDTYYVTRNARPALTPAYEDTGAAVHGTETPGDQHDSLHY